MLGIMDNTICQMLILRLYAEDEESGDDGGLVVSKEGGSNLDAGRNGDTKGMDEVKELVRAALSSAINYSVEDKVTENCDVQTTTPTTTTTE